MLTKEMLEAMPPETTFATGVTMNEGLYKEPVRWVAIRGGIPDWAIYYHKEEMPMDYVEKAGDKCFTKDIIKLLVPCDESAMKMYRY